MQSQDCTRRAPSTIQPDRLSRGRERRVRQGESESLSNHLCCCSGAKELASATRRCTGATANLSRVLKCYLILSKACADSLYFSRIFSRLRQQRNTSGNKNGRRGSRRCQRHHHGGQPLVAGGDADYAFLSGQRAHETAENNRCIISKGERIQHACGALRTAVAGVGASSGERHRAKSFQLT